MKINYFLKSVVTAVALIASLQMSAIQKEATISMTYVDKSFPADAQYGNIEENGYAMTGYNKVTDSSLSFAYEGWNRNRIAFVKVDLSDIEGDIKSISLSIEGSGSTDSKRNGYIGVGYVNTDWIEAFGEFEDMSYSWYEYAVTNEALTFTNLTASPVKLAKSKDDFTPTEFDITKAFQDGTTEAIIAVYSTNAGGIFVKNPKVTVNYTPADAADATYTVYYVDAEGNSIKDPEERTGKVGETFVPTEADKADLVVDGKTYTYTKYVAENDIADDGSTEVYLYYADQTTGVKNIIAEGKNANAVLYNLNGQRVDASYKGVVIKNGKKVLNK